QGPGLDPVAQLPKTFPFVLIGECVGPLLHQRIHGGTEVGTQLVIRQGSGGPAAEVGGQFGDWNSLAHTAPLRAGVLTRSHRKLARCRPRKACCCFSSEPLMFNRQPPSAVTISTAPESIRARVLSITMAP